MGETASKNVWVDSIMKSLGIGAVLGVVVVLLSRFLVPFEPMAIGGLLFVVGATLSVWAEDWWLSVGRSLVGTGLVILALFPFVVNL